VALLVDEDFVLITAIKETELTKPRVDGCLSGKNRRKAGRCGEGRSLRKGSFVRRGGGRGTVAAHFSTKIHSPRVFEGHHGKR
jgi:hypothetical protein